MYLFFALLHPFQHSTLDGVVGAHPGTVRHETSLRLIRCDIFQVDVGLFEPFFQVLERDYHVNEVIKVVRFQLLADTGTCKHDFHIFPI